MKSLLVQHNSNNKIIIHNNIHVGFACVQLSALDSAVSFLYTLDVWPYKRVNHSVKSFQIFKRYGIILNRGN